MGNGEWGMGNGEWGMGRNNNDKHQTPNTNYRLPITDYQCPMPHNVEVYIIFSNPYTNDFSCKTLRIASSTPGI
ncbi:MULTISPECIES: hypothetical protein [unclassified Tolypothrix]|uniref:hypothetical protein n=1 Tax=unclassified Tolypothrix TaxID=2649714 RepID=UPI001438D755|nr:MULTISPECIES: hypothetical protein [unclassified Tolypothrix]